MGAARLFLRAPELMREAPVVKDQRGRTVAIMETVKFNLLGNRAMKLGKQMYAWRHGAHAFPLRCSALRQAALRIRSHSY